MAIVRAYVTEVPFGSFSIEGLMNENGDFGVAVPQMAALKLIPPNRSAKQLQALTGVPFQSHQKWTTSLHPKAVNVISLSDFQGLVRALDKQGNAAASEFVDAMFGLSLHQLFADAFGRRFEAEERQYWLVARQITKHDFRPLTDELQRHGFVEAKDYARFVAAFQAKLGIECGTRDRLPIEKLVDLQGAQVKLTTLMQCGHTPWQALSRLASA